jgi:mannosyltransferase OCH1-like enzyme
MDSNIGIPKKMGHIWVGPLPPPIDWMRTWRQHHPDWEYTLYGNRFLHDFTFRTRRQIEEYMKRGQYAGVSDLMRLEILYQFGGMLPEADSICLRGTEHLYANNGAYTVYENEFIRGKLVSPILAASPGNEFVRAMIDELSKIDPADLDEPWISTGNLFTARMIDALSPRDLTIFPSHYFIPIHFTGVMYQGNDTVFACQMFGTTRNAYRRMSALERLAFSVKKMKIKVYNFHRLSSVRRKKMEYFHEFPYSQE